MMRAWLVGCVFAVSGLGSAPALAADAGRFKTVQGEVHVQRGAERVPARVGMVVQESDTIVTGADGAAGVGFLDNSLLSVGPNSVLAVEQYAFNATTHQGRFDAALRKGTLAVVSGKMVRNSPGAMRIRTPATIMGVRGTEFVVRVGDTER